jgi:hypothetical protein
MNTVGRNKKKKKTNAFDSKALFFYALNFLMVPFSGAMTYYGFTNLFQMGTFGPVNVPALFIALITSLLFLAINFSIRENRLKGRPHKLQAAMYIVPMVFSCFGNFAALYDEARRGFWIEAEADQALGAMQSAKEILKEYAETKEKGIAQIETEYGKYITRMETSNETQGFTGIGPEVKKQWKDCKEYLRDQGVELTYFREDGNAEQYLIVNAKRYAQMGFSEYAESVRQEYTAVVTDIDTLYHHFEGVKSNHFHNHNDYKATGCGFINEIASHYNKFVDRSKAQVEAMDGVEFSGQKLESGVCSKFDTPSYILNDAFVKMPSPPTTIGYGLVALLLDLAALLYVLIFVEPPKKIGPAPIVGRNRK